MEAKKVRGGSGGEKREGGREEEGGRKAVEVRGEE